MSDCHVRKRRLNFLRLVTKVHNPQIIISYYHNHITSSHERYDAYISFILSIHFGSHFHFLSLDHGAKAVTALFGWKALFLQASHGPEIRVARHHHVLPRIEARRTSARVRVTSRPLNSHAVQLSCMHSYAVCTCEFHVTRYTHIHFTGLEHKLQCRYGRW